MQKIVPHLWFDKEAREASKFYVSVFGDESKIHSTTTLHDTPSGDTEFVSFGIWGYNFAAISAGPVFKLNPSISFMVNFDPSQDKNAKAKIDTIWEKLSEEGKILMPLDKYPFSEHYGWVEDKYGVSWQLIYTNPEGEKRPLIIPSLLFVNNVYGKAEEASDFYINVFKKAPHAKNSQRGSIARYPAGMEPDKEGAVMFTDFSLHGQWFAAMDSAREHKFMFNEAVSFMVNCETQEEIDYFWENLSAVPEAEQCGWLKDKYDVSWQIVPAILDKLLATGDESARQVTQAFLKMKKLDIKKLMKAHKGK